jgi:Integrase core domain
MNDKIKRQYLNPKVKGSFSGVQNFYGNSNKKYTKKQILDTLLTIPAYVENRPAPTKFKRRKVFVHGIDEQWVMDLIEISKNNVNDNYNNKYLLTVMDAFSKFAWISALKNKQSSTVLKAFKDILKKSNRVCKYIQSDLGNEFRGSFRDFLVEKNIKYFSVQSELKCCLIERFNRTIMEKVERFLIHQRNSAKRKKIKHPNRFLNVLKYLLKSYNSSVHRSTKKRPIDVNEENSMEVWMNLYGSEEMKSHDKPKFKVGDKCLISIVKNIFEKGYSRKFKPEIFTIYKVGNSYPRMFYLKDNKNEPIEGGFYSQELSLVRYDEKSLYLKSS